MVPTDQDALPADGNEILPRIRLASTLPDWWAKFNRGQEHRDELQHFITETLAKEGNLPTLAVKFDATTLQHVLYVKRTPDLSQFYSRVGLVFGDCVNNIRNALDYLVHEMGVRHTAKIGGLRYPERIKFPILSKREGWAGVAGKELKEVSEAQREAIESFQPYHGRDLEQDVPQGQNPYHPLAMLRELTDFDKHRLLTPVVVPHGSAIAVGALAMAMMYSGSCQIMHADWGGLPVELGAEIWRAKLPDDMPKEEEEIAGRIDTLILLTQAHSRPVIPLIDTIAGMVKKTMLELEATL